MWLDWHVAAWIAFAVWILFLFTRRSTQPVLHTIGAVSRELSIILVLYAIWRLAGTLSIMQVDDASNRGIWIWHAERWLPLPRELTLQSWALPHPWVVQFCNRYYAIFHGPSLMAFLIWMFSRHREHYAKWRNIMAMVTGWSLAIQLIPVAPPRLLPGLGFVDTGHLYGQSVYGALGSGMADQLSALPSVHVAWAVIIGIAVVRTSTSKWRWLILAHTFTTIVVVVVTGNHWWADGLVAIALIGVAAVVQALASKVMAWARQRGARLIGKGDGHDTAVEGEPQPGSGPQQEAPEEASTGLHR